MIIMTVVLMITIMKSLVSDGIVLMIKTAMIAMSGDKKDGSDDDDNYVAGFPLLLSYFKLKR